MRSIGRAKGSAMVTADVTGSVLELGRLPVRTVAPTLSDELQVAVESVETVGSQVCRYLALQRGLRVIIGATHGSGHRQLQGFVIRCSTAGKSCQRDRRKGDESMACPLTGRPI